MATQKDVKTRITSVKNIRKITRAMEMVAAARLRRAEQRIDAMRPYAQAIRRMTQRVAEAAGPGGNRVAAAAAAREASSGSGSSSSPATAASRARSTPRSSAPACSSKRELEADGEEVAYYVVGRRGNSALTFRGESVVDSFTGFTDRPAFANARDDRRPAHRRLRRRGARPGRADLQPLRLAADPVRAPPDAAAAAGGGGLRRGHPRRAGGAADPELAEAQSAPEWIYEPEPEEALTLLFEEYVNLSVFRALLESAASEHGARMTAMRSAAENAGDMIESLTLEMNRVRQAEITQEILEVVGGAEALGSS